MQTGRYRFMNVIWLGLGVLCLAESSALQAEGQETTGRKYAVLVGVDEYDPNQLRNLQYPANDVQELAELLEKGGFRRVVLLTQARGAKTQRALPLAKNIYAELKGILDDRTPDDLVLVAFAGHGVQFAGEEGSYFCPMDAVLTDRSTLVSMADVYRLLEQSKAGTKLMLVDACRNDPQSANSRSLAEVKLESVTRSQQIALPGGVAALFSCSAGQKAFEDASLKHGIFFHHVILGLKGEAKLSKRDEVTWDSLVAYVKAEVPDTVKDKIGSTSRQTPEHRGELRGGATLVSLSRGKPAELPPSNTNPSSTKELPQNYVSKSTGMKFTLIPAGTFQMGSPTAEAERKMEEGPQHTVQISQPFYMGVYEVTQAEFEEVMGTNLSEYSKTGFSRFMVNGIDTRRFPVDNLTWFDAVEFCNKLSERNGWTPYYVLTKITRSVVDRSIPRANDRNGSIKGATVSLSHGSGCRLPTEAEWEYACRAGTTTPFHFGGTLNGGQANVNGEFPYGMPFKGVSLKRTTTVGSYAENAFGLFDMHGNMQEWCEDVFDESLYSKRSGTTKDPLVTSGSNGRVLRGGDFGYRSGRTRSAARTMGDPGGYLNPEGLQFAGFRVVLPSSTVRTP